MNAQPTPEEMFDDYMRGHGGRLEVSLLDKEVQELLSRVEKRANGLIRLHLRRVPRTNPRPLHFDFVMNTRVNAVAFGEELDFIGIYSGTVLVLMDIFNRMLSYPEVLPWIGTPALETGNPILLNRLSADAKDLHGGRFGVFFPKDKARANFANELMGLALDFLVAHELGHVTNGHVDLRKRTTANAVIEEAVGNILDDQLGLTMQTLEMDADAFAMQYLLGKSFELVDGLPAIEDATLRQQIAGVYASREDAVFALGFVVYVLFRLFGEIDWDVAKLAQRSHPPAPLRHFMVSALIPGLLQKWKLEQQGDEFIKTWVKALSVAEKACALVIGGTPVWGGVHRARNEESQAHASQLLERWKTLRPQLEPLKRGGNLAP